ncbi:hypothetical protein [Phaeodactylibacter xiamenensis]|uniref:hypothetical protein n=1 Tax=Phaeodactylibacter xiamenensis TaxID=1524460 RepID=UPI003BA8E7C6
MNKITITLIENGEHSLRKGIKAYNTFQESSENVDKDKMYLKEALMFIHHGVELLMKEVLVRKSEYLIFSDLKAATRKQNQANSSGIGIFYLEKPPHTVTYTEAIDRVCAFVEKLDDDFQKTLIELNNFRNQIEHYQIDVTKDEIQDIIDNVLPSLEKFLEEKLSIRLSSDIEEEIKIIHKSRVKRHQFNSMAEKDFADILPFLSGQLMDKEIMNSDHDVKIPKISKVIKDLKKYSKERGFRYVPDFLIKNGDQDWIVEVKGIRFSEHTLYNLIDFLDKSKDNVQLWLVTIGDLDNELLKKRLKEKGVYLSNLYNLKEEVKKRREANNG